MKKALLLIWLVFACYVFSMTVFADYDPYQLNPDGSWKCNHNEGTYDSALRNIDENYHGYDVICATCGAILSTEKQRHENWQDKYAYMQKDKTSHIHLYECSDCGAEKQVTEAHEWKEEYCKRKATLTTYAIIHYSCDLCGETYDKSEKFDPESSHSIKYFDVEGSSDIYRNSKYFTAKLTHPLKGGVIKLKIGKKTYKKKIKNNSKKIKIKIKKPKWGKNYTVELTYKGKYIYSDWFTVWYAKNVKVGMTTKQVNYVRDWCEPEYKTSRSGGWKFWHYENGSMVAFKNGKVKYWRKVSR